MIISTPPDDKTKVWLNKNNNVLYIYRNENWISIQKYEFVFYLSDKIYTGYFNNELFVKEPIIITSLKCIYLKCKDIQLQIDRNIIYSFSSPIFTDLNILVPKFSTVQCYIPVEKDRKTITNTFIHIEYVWKYE